MSKIQFACAKKASAAAAVWERAARFAAIKLVRRRGDDGRAASLHSALCRQRARRSRELSAARGAGRVRAALGGARVRGELLESFATIYPFASEHIERAPSSLSLWRMSSRRARQVGSCKPPERLRRAESAAAQARRTGDAPQEPRPATQARRTSRSAPTHDAWKV